MSYSAWGLIYPRVVMDRFSEGLQHASWRMQHSSGHLPNLSGGMPHFILGTTQFFPGMIYFFCGKIHFSWRINPSTLEISYFLQNSDRKSSSCLSTCFPDLMPFLSCYLLDKYQSRDNYVTTRQKFGIRYFTTVYLNWATETVMYNRSCCELCSIEDPHSKKGESAQRPCHQFIGQWVEDPDVFRGRFETIFFHFQIHGYETEHHIV